jgi:O-antigen ligase
MTLNRTTSQKNIDMIIFGCSMLFYAILWFTNPNNKMILILCGVLLGALYAHLKNSWLTILAGIFVLQIISTGKSYEITLVSPGIFSLDFWPNGYTINITLSPGFLLSMGLLPLLIKKFTTNNLQVPKLIWPDVFFSLYIAWILLSNLFGSSWPETSILLSVFVISQYLVYISLRMTHTSTLPKIFFTTLVSLTIIESMLAIHQFSVGGPLGKSIEAQQNIQLFGEASDELSFRFRPTGTTEHANALGGFLAYTIAYLIPEFFINPTVPVFIALALGVTAITLTLSRAAWLGLAAGLIFFLLVNKRHIRLTFTKFQIISITSTCIILFVFFIYPRIIASLNVASQTGGAYIRQLQTNAIFSLINRHPIFGVGSGMSVPETLAIDPTGIFSQFPATIHNAYLALAAENGIPALLFFVLFVLSYLRWFIVKKIIHKPFVINSIAGSIAIGIVMLFQPYGYSWLVMIGLIVAEIYEENIHTPET